jgi:quercetin dioxygenase-like cupin family protein
MFDPDAYFAAKPAITRKREAHAIFDTKDGTTYRFAAGEGLPDHEHSHVHDCVLVAGSVLVKIDGQPDLVMNEFKDRVALPANTMHSITALVDETTFVNTILSEDTTA